MEEANNKDSQKAQTPQSMPGEIGYGQHSQKKWLYIGLAAAAILIIGVLAWMFLKDKPAPVVEKKTYKVGVMTIDNFTQSFGQNITRGVELATQAFTSDKVAIEVVKKATDCKADLAKKAMEEFAAEGVVAVVGEFCSDATLAAGEIANQKHIPLISGASTSANITTAGEYVFRTIPSDMLAIEYLADVMYNKHNVRRVAILYSNDAYGNGGRDALKASFEKLGGQIVSDEKYEKSQTDVREELKRGKAANPDAFFTVGATGINSTILVQKREVGFNAQMYGLEGFKSERGIEASNGASEGIFVVSGRDPIRSFAEKYQAVYNEDVLGRTYTSQYYDAMLAIAFGLERGATSGETLKDQLHQVSFDGVSDYKIEFDENGDVKGAYGLYTVKNNKPALVE